jgi:hypothetical protein
MGLTWGANISLNLLYVLKRYFPRFVSLDRPIDGKLNFIDNKRLIGDSTTVLGIVVVILFSLVAFYSGLFNSTVAVVTPFLVYMGHALGSFIKRRLKKGEGFVPFVDHGDYVFFSGLILCLGGYISFNLALICLLLTYVLHPLAVVWAFKLGLREHNY